MTFILPALPYGRDALSPYISPETLDYHHGKHHQAYVDKSNDLVAAAGLEGKSLVDVIRAAKLGPLLNNASQLWNHSFFWQCLSPDAPPPTGQLADLISAGFGSTETLLKALETEAVDHFGSGWVWLVLEDGALRIRSLHDGDSPVAHDGMVPLFALDVWEHAYYIDYRSARNRYVEATLSHLVNWSFVAKNLDGEGFSRGNHG